MRLAATFALVGREAGGLFQDTDASASRSARMAPSASHGNHIAVPPQPLAPSIVLVEQTMSPRLYVPSARRHSRGRTRRDDLPPDLRDPAQIDRPL